jgi:hypothetical protein
MGRHFLYGHAEWVETRNLTAGNFDSHLTIKGMVLPRNPCFPPTHYVVGRAIYVTTFTRFAQNWSNGSPLTLYSSTMLFYAWGHIFFVWSPKLHTVAVYIWGIWEPPESLHGHTEWFETRDLLAGKFDSHLRIKLMAISIGNPCSRATG